MKPFYTSPVKSRKSALYAACVVGLFVLSLGLLTLGYAVPVDLGTPATLNVIPHVDIFGWFETRAGLAQLLSRAFLVIMAVGAAMIVAYRRARSLTAPEPVERTYFAGDPQFYVGERARTKLCEQFAREAGTGAPGGLWIAPHVQLPAAKEVENIFINGNQNSGKSTIFRALVGQKIRSGAHVFIHCFKGEHSIAFGEQDAVLIAPHVSRTWSWDVANDVVNAQDARELACRVIPASDNPFWSDAARAIFTELLVNLMGERGRDWSWFDLGKAMFTSPEQIKDILAKTELSAHPLLMMNEEGQATNTTHGVLATLITAVLTTIKPLAIAWARTAPERRFSVRRWLIDPTFPFKVVIFQSSARHKELSNLIGRAIIDSVRACLADSSVSDSDERRVVLALDEMAQLGELDTFHNLIATGRSKGLMVIGATQSIAQLKELYKGRSEIIRQLFRWQIVSKVPQGEPGEALASALMSKRKVWWMEANQEREGRKDRPLWVRKEDERYAFTPAEMERDLGIVVNDEGKKVVRVLLLGGGDVYLLEYPNTTWFARRRKFVPAKWTAPIKPAVKRKVLAQAT